MDIFLWTEKPSLKLSTTANGLEPSMLNRAMNEFAHQMAACMVNAECFVERF